MKNNKESDIKNNKESDIYKICNILIKKYNLYWQYPVVTEKNVFIQQKNNPLYIGLPWASIIDKSINIKILLIELLKYIDLKKKYITCCQHISFRRIIPVLKILNIKTLYTPHKIKNEDMINDINISPCPLYAVNLEDNNRNIEFRDINYIDTKRDILYSFMGGYQNFYLTNIRKRIFEIKHPKNTFIKHTGDWHFNSIVYKYQVRNKLLSQNDINRDINNTKIYNLLLLKSKFSLCPSGSGPNTIRFWESLGVGCIPILLSDTLELPKHELWNDAILIVKEKDINKIPKILSEIDDEREKNMRINCIKIYNDLKDNFLRLNNE
jgi:WD40 repeat protein